MITPLVSADDPLRQDLAPDEKLLWAGAPPGGLRLRAADAALIPFSLMWGGFALFWEAQVLHHGAPLLFALWGLPFVAVGLYLIAGRFFVDAWTRARTRYAVTSQRVLIVLSSGARSVKSLPLSALTDISVKSREDGSGEVVLGGANLLALGTWVSAGSRARYAPPTLEGLPDAREVAELIRRAQREAS